MTPINDLYFAGPGIRGTAFVLDWLIRGIIALPFVFDQFGDDGTLDSPDNPLLYFGVFVVVHVLFALMTAYLGGSPGKLILKLRVTTDDGQTTPPGLKRAVLRTTPSLLPFVPLLGGAITVVLPLANGTSIVMDDQRRSLHDRVGGTRVVYKDRLNGF